MSNKKERLTIKCAEKHALRKKTTKDEPTLQTFVRLSTFFKVMGDQTRLKILWLLTEDELCVCEIAELTEMSSSAISHQLKVLRDTRLVKFRKDGKNVFYSLDDEHIREIFKTALEHVSE